MAMQFRIIKTQPLPAKLRSGGAVNMSRIRPSGHIASREGQAVCVTISPNGRRVGNFGQVGDSGTRPADRWLCV